MTKGHRLVSQADVVGSGLYTNAFLSHTSDAAVSSVRVYYYRPCLYGRDEPRDMRSSTGGCVSG